MATQMGQDGDVHSALGKFIEQMIGEALVLMIPLGIEDVVVEIGQCAFEPSMLQRLHHRQNVAAG